MKKLVVGLVAVVVIVGLLIALAMMNRSSSVQPSSSPTVSPISNATGSPQTNATVSVVYNDSGFSPAQTKVNAGQSITFTNRSSEQIQVDSDPHPIHTDDPELNVGVIAAGQSKTVTLTKKGDFGFHNHLNPSMKARVTIQ